MNRVYSLTDLGNGYFIPTMMDGKHFYHYKMALYSMNSANRYMGELTNSDFVESDWHIVV